MPRALNPRARGTANSDFISEPEPDEPSKAPKAPSIRRLVLALGICLIALFVFLRAPPSLEQTSQLPPMLYPHHDDPATSIPTSSASMREPPAVAAAIATTAATPWLPAPASSGEIANAKKTHAALGLLSLGGVAGRDAFLVGVRASTGTVDAVSPVSLPHFSYTLPLIDATVKVHWANSGRVPLPLDRTAEGFHHLGDITLRVRKAGSTGGYSTHSTVSRKPPLATAANNARVAADGLSASTDATKCLTPPITGLSLKREVKLEGSEVHLSLTLTNNDQTNGIEIGGLGFSMPMNQMFTGRSLPQVAKACSFTEVYVGGDAGYVQVTRTTGEGPALLALPLKGGSSTWRGFEGWRPLKQEDRANYDWMHEMLYEVVIHSKAYANAEWRSATSWAPPTAAVIPAGGSATYGLRLILSKDVESVSDALLAAKVPVAVPLPATTLHADMKDARLHLLTPKGLELTGSPESDPPGCLEATATSADAGLVKSLQLKPKSVGRCRLTLNYNVVERTLNGPRELTQFVHYHILEPAKTLLQRHGDFASSVGWLPANSSDPWHRGPGFMGTDADANGGHGGALLHDPRVFMAGHSDESGASAPLAMSVKQLGLPSAAEVAKLEEYVHGTLWAGKSGTRSEFLQGNDYSVRLSMLYWNNDHDADPTGPAQRALPALYTHCHKCWSTCSKKRDCCYWMHCWSEEHSLETWRAYNYPHVTVDYWALYRVARHFSPPLTKRADWRWYLEQAGRTAIAMYKFGGRGTSQWGLMVGSIFVTVLDDLRKEGFNSLADELEGIKERRMRKWMSMLFPYGSEFPWDSTGHEEIHSWLLHDNKLADANKTVQAVLAYSTVVPNWAYCGSARRYWDFTINGKTQWGNEREFHHYGSTLNAVAVLDSYRAFPNRHYLLQLGACSLLGHLSNIHPNGAYGMAWHGDPGLLRRDGFSGDYGPGVYGYWRSAAAYVTCMPPFGWSCFLCDLVVSGNEAPSSRPLLHRRRRDARHARDHAA